MSVDRPLQIEVIQQVHDDPREIVLEFLDSIDPKNLERTALERLGWGDLSVVELALEVLKDIARG